MAEALNSGADSVHIPVKGDIMRRRGKTWRVDSVTNCHNHGAKSVLSGTAIVLDYSEESRQLAHPLGM